MFEAKIEFDNFYKAIRSVKNIGRNAIITNDGNDWMELRVYDEDSCMFGDVIFKDPHVHTDLINYRFAFNIDKLASVIESLRGACKIVKIIADYDIAFDFGEFILSLDLIDVKDSPYSYDIMMKWIECGYYVNKDNLDRFFKCGIYSDVSFSHTKSNLRVTCASEWEKFLLTADVSKSVWKMNEDFVGETRFDCYKTKFVLLPMIQLFDDEVSIGFKKDYPLVCYVENTDLFVLTSLAPVADADEILY